MNLDAMKKDIKGELSEGDWTPEKMIQEFTDTVWDSVQELNEEKYKRDEFRLKASALEEARLEACDAISTYLEIIDELMPEDKKTLEAIKNQINHKLCSEKKKDIGYKEIDRFDKVIQDFLKSLG